jgi:type I restriction enzyme S subunit
VWPSGTLCITIAATIGKCSILSFDACFPDSVVGYLINKELISNEYVYFLFGCLQSILEANAPSVAQKNINLNK